MRTLVLTGYTDEYAPLGLLTAPRWKEYADRHGYGFALARDYRSGVHPCWEKLRHIAEALPSCGLLFYAGADTLCTNLQTPLPVSLGRHEIAASLDWIPGATWASTDALLVRNTPTMLALFREAQTLKPQCRVGGYDLTALMELFSRNPEYAKRLLLLPRRRFQAVPVECGFPNEISPCQIVEPWSPGDFVMHVTGVPLAKRVEIVRKYI